MIQKEWRWVRDCGEEYKVYEDGKVYSMKSKKFLSQYKSGGSEDKRYYSTGLTINGKTKLFYIHRLVAESFLENHENKRCVNHIDGNKENNHYENLEFVTHRENTLHAYKNKLIVPRPMVGESHGMAVLNNDKVRAIRKLRNSGSTYSFLSKAYGVSSVCIRDICIRKLWKHVA
jgi:hypothetical protein